MRPPTYILIHIAITSAFLTMHYGTPIWCFRFLFILESRSSLSLCFFFFIFWLRFCVWCARPRVHNRNHPGVRHDLKSWLIAWSSACCWMEGQKRATSAIDRKTLESGHDRHQQPGGIQFKNQERKKKEKEEKNKCTLSNHPAPFFLWVGHLNTQRTARICCSWRRQHKKMIIKSLCAV